MEIKEEIERLQFKLTELKRKERQSNPSVLSKKQAENIKEYERRVSAGEDVAPLIEHIELEDLVGTEIFESVLKNEGGVESHCFQLRGCNIHF